MPRNNNQENIYTFPENTGPFVMVPNEILRDQRLKRADWLIYSGVKMFMNNETKFAYPSRKAVSERIHKSPRTITSALTRLENAGYIKRHFRFNGSTIYEFLI